MPLIKRVTKPVVAGEKKKTPRPYEHAMCGTTVRVREDQNAWHLADESEDYEHAVVELVIDIRGTEYAQCYVRDAGDNHVIACMSVPAASLTDFIVEQ